MRDRITREIAQIRAYRPEAIAEAAIRRRRRPLLGYRERLMIIAADHPARASLAAGGRPMAMANRWDLLERLVVALARPDIIEDLLVLGALEDKVVIGSMNRGGLAGSTFELDDRFTGYDAGSLAEMGFDGGKMLLRIDRSDPTSVRTIEACARAVDDLAGHRLMAMVEPFLCSRVEGRVCNDLSVDAVVASVAVASGLGATSAYTWLKLPVVDDMAPVLEASTLPVLLLGGDTSGTEDAAGEMYARWRKALEFPTVRGIVAGRALLYPSDDDVAGAVDRAVRLG